MLAEDRVRLRHMIEAAESAMQFIAGRQRTDLDEDRMLLFALVRAIIGMRNRLMHAYFEINTEIVWQTATQEIPALLPQLRALATDE